MRKQNFVYATFLALWISCLGLHAQKFQVPVSPRTTYNMNIGWKFIKQDVPGADAASFDDSQWQTISTPHTYNDVDTYDEIISRGGEKSEYMGIAWYRKHFKLPADQKGKKVFIEFEGMRQAGRFYINGKAAGMHENGVTPCGVDITNLVNFGDQENILAVKIDNSADYKEEASGIGFQWMSKDFNPNYGGINRNVWLHVTGRVYQSLPLYDGLQARGVYVYPKNISVTDKTADINIESEVRNESGDQKSVDLSAVVVDASGNVCANIKGETYDMVGGEKYVLNASGKLANLRLWSVEDPYLYDVYSILTIDGKVEDVTRIRTGFRKAEFKGGVGKGGVYLNDKFVYLKGYAQRSSNEWAGLGQSYPDWMHDYTADCLRKSNGNYMRWMHVAPQAVDVRSCDKYGIIEACPAGDKEKDAEGRQWEQRKEVMRSTIIYYRNNPSIFFWEAGNNGISGVHMKEMFDLKREWDPNGMRAMGCRTLNDTAATPYAEYFGVMIAQDDSKDNRKTYNDLFRAYSQQRRDLAPFIETEDFREEAARRFWDSHSAPHYGFHKKPNDTHDFNSESLCLGAIKRYNDYYSNIITNTDPEHSKWSAYCSIIFTESNSHGRQYDSEVCRVSGKMDAVRLPKPIYFTHRVMQNTQPDIYIIGHWNYADSVTKNMYVVSNCEEVEFFVNGKSKGKTKPENGFQFTFPNIKWEAGSIKAIGYNKGKAVCNTEIKTAGAPKSIKLTVTTGNKGLIADGADIALIDFEVVDEKGNRCPTDEARVDFEVSGPCVWRGGYNSGIPGSTNNLYLNTECGINRVSLRSTQAAGNITVTAKREGLKSASVQISSKALVVDNGLSKDFPQVLTEGVK